MKKSVYSLAFALFLLSQSAFSSEYYYLGCVDTKNDVQFSGPAINSIYTEQGFIKTYRGSTYIDFDWANNLYVVSHPFTTEEDAGNFCASLTKQCKSDNSSFTGSFAAYAGGKYIYEIYVRIHPTTLTSEDSYKSCEYLAGYAAAKGS